LAAGGIGCGVLVIAFIVAVFMVWSWLSAPAPIVPAEHYPDQATRGFLVMHIRPEHADYLAQADTLIDRAPVGDQAERLKEADAEDIKKVLPLQVVVVLDPDGEEEFQLSGVFAMSRYLRGMTWLLRRGSSNASETVTWIDEDVPVLRAQETQHLLVPVEDALMITADTAVAENWVKRHRAALADAGEAEELPVPELDTDARLAAAYGRATRDSMVAFALLNTNGELPYVMERLATNLEPDEREIILAAQDRVLSLAGQIAPVDNETGDLTLYVETPDRESADLVRQAIEQIAEENEGMQDVAFEVGEGHEGAMLLTVDARVIGWFEWSMRSFDKAAAQTDLQEPPVDTPVDTSAVPEDTP
jgi:hypothetical protein